jgi:hypothetical protein
VRVGGLETALCGGGEGALPPQWPGARSPSGQPLGPSAWPWGQAVSKGWGEARACVGAGVARAGLPGGASARGTSPASDVRAEPPEGVRLGGDQARGVTQAGQGENGDGVKVGHIGLRRRARRTPGGPAGGACQGGTAALWGASRRRGAGARRPKKTAHLECVAAGGRPAAHAHCRATGARWAAGRERGIKVAGVAPRGARASSAARRGRGAARRRARAESCPKKVRG